MTDDEYELLKFYYQFNGQPVDQTMSNQVLQYDYLLNDFLYVKNWLDGGWGFDTSITGKGKIAFQQEELKRKREEFKEELSMSKLQSEIKDLENRLNNFKPSNIRANIAIIVGIISAVLSLIAIILKLK
jgi:hypothetical protein